MWERLELHLTILLPDVVHLLVFPTEIVGHPPNRPDQVAQHHQFDARGLPRRSHISVLLLCTLNLTFPLQEIYKYAY